MTVFDYIIIAIIAYNSFIGLKQGAIRMISGLIGIIIATSISKLIFQTTFDDFAASIAFLNTYPFIYYGICFVVILIGCQLIANLIHSIFKWSGIGIFNHILGLFLGCFRGLFFSLFIIVPLILSQSNYAKTSLIIPHITPISIHVIQTLNQYNFFNNLFPSQSLSSSAQKSIKGVSP